MINEKEYINAKELSKNLDKVILSESKILKKNLKCNKQVFNFNLKVSYV